MSRYFECPSCKKRVPLTEIHLAVVDPYAPPEWWCRVCKQSASREQWGQSNDGISATETFFYLGKAKSESFLKKLPRAIVRKATFAASKPVIGSYKKIREKTQFDMGGPANDRRVAIWHASERYMLQGRYYEPRGNVATKVVVCFSGSGGVAGNYLGWVATNYVHRLKVAVLLVDYRGFALSDRKAPSEEGLFTDARAMWAYLTEGIEMGGLGWRPNQVVIHGYSLGTGVAAQLATEKKHCAGLILQCPFRSAMAMAKEQGGAIGGWLAKHGSRLDVINKIGSVSKPIMVLVAEDDDMRPHGEAIYNQYRTTKNISLVSYSGDHEDPHNVFQYKFAPFSNWFQNLP